jgi:phage gp36-like protein
MAYLTRDQIALYCSDKELPDDPENQGLNEELIISTISVTENEINNYLMQGGYKLPLESGSELKILHLTIPVYRYHITFQSGLRTESILKDYEIALSKLQKIAEGKLTLSLKTNDTDEIPVKSNSGMFLISTGRR